MIEVRGLRKQYGAREAVAGVDLSIREGEVFALLGPNGAGKTTIVEILEGYRERTTGDVSVLGFDPGREHGLRERIGIVLQTTGVERYLSVREMIDQFRGYYRRPRPTDELLALVGLTGDADTRVRKLSGGQRRRLDLAIGLAGDPDLLFLDEPTTGFDPGARRQAWDVVRNLTGLGKTVVLTTHFMDEAQVLADRIAVLVRGVIVAQGSPTEIIGRGSQRTTIRFRLPAGAPPIPVELGAQPSDDGCLIMDTDAPTEHLHRLTGWAIESGVAFEELTASRPSLEDAYLALTGDAQGSDAQPAVSASARASDTST